MEFQEGATVPKKGSCPMEPVCLLCKLLFPYASVHSAGGVGPEWHDVRELREKNRPIVPNWSNSLLELSERTVESFTLAVTMK
jgi:hypothetical protein